MKRYLFVFLTLLAAARLDAQQPAAPAAGTTNVEVDPIRCWWRTSAGSVRTGETFDLALTCATLDTEAVQVVPDESRLGPAVVQMAPFEVVGGSHPADMRSGSRRFFQYQYTLRIINPDMIGRDVRIPDLVIHYRINSRVAENAALQGRDLVYMLPTQSVRLASMVPGDAPDIRDAGGEDFGIAEGLTFRASVLEIVAITCVVLGVLMIVLAAVGVFRRAGARTPASERLLPVRSVVGAASRALRDVQQERERGGWTPALLSRAAAAARIIGACAIGRPVSQRPADAAATETEGRVLVSGGFRRPGRVLSSPLTAFDLSRVSGAAAPERQATLDQLREALSAFSEPQYRRDAAIDQGALDRALSSTLDAATKVKSEHSWLKDALKQVRMGNRAVTTRA